MYALGDLRRRPSSAIATAQERSVAVLYKTYAYENFKKSYPYAKGHGMKQAVVAPSMLYLLYPLNGTVEGVSEGDIRGGSGEWVMRRISGGVF